MIKRIKSGVTKLEDLHEVFGVSKEELENKKAKLFPTGMSDKENSTTSIFLATLGATKEFRQYLFSSINVNKINGKTSKLHVYTELPSEDSKNRPDGLAIITSGVKTPVIEYAAFFETKVGSNCIEQDQIDRYINFAKDKGIENIITISNQLVPTPFDSPVSTKKKINLFHWSWPYIKVMSSYLIRCNMIEDEDHTYILSELRRYMDSHKNISHFKDMGDQWKETVANIHATDPTVKLTKKLIDPVVESYSQEEKDLSLCLTDKSNYLVNLVVKKDRYQEITEMLDSTRVITSSYMIDSEKKNCFEVWVDFTRQAIQCIYKVEVHKGKSQAQTTKLLQMLEGVALGDDVLIKAVYQRNRVKKENAEIPYSQLMCDKEAGEPYSILDKNLGDEVKHFEIKMKRILGVRDFQGKRNFVSKLEETATSFVQQVITILNKKH